MEHNESTFCSLWTEHIKINDCTNLFINEKLGDDHFFNRTSNTPCCYNGNAHDNDGTAISALQNSVRRFSERRLKCFVYIDESDSRMEAILLKNKFTLLDTMQCFRSNMDKIRLENQKIHVDKIGMDLLPVWIDVFCKSFNALDWKSEVHRILETHFHDLILLIGYIKSNSSPIPAGCAMLFSKHKVNGLYCLGTLESFRRQGVAGKIVQASLDISKRSSNSFLICQAFTNEGFAEFYKKLGFQLVYKKKIYALDG
jgi:ribosomal protein S18 acetylase RimI-like enzyme